MELNVPVTHVPAVPLLCMSKSAHAPAVETHVSAATVSVSQEMSLLRQQAYAAAAELYVLALTAIVRVEERFPPRK